MSIPAIPFGERVVSWKTVWQRLYPSDEGESHDDEAASEMHRLRGLVIGQAAETEFVLGQILCLLDPAAKIDRPSGSLLYDIRAKLDPDDATRCDGDLQTVDDAIKRRNRVVHSVAAIGSVWVSYARGWGGEWVPVISILGYDEYNESDLMSDLVSQQQATVAAIQVWRGLEAAAESAGP